MHKNVKILTVLFGMATALIAGSVNAQNTGAALPLPGPYRAMNFQPLQPIQPVQPLQQFQPLLRPTNSNFPALPYWMQPQRQANRPAPIVNQGQGANTVARSNPAPAIAPFPQPQQQQQQQQFQFVPGWGWVPFGANAQGGYFAGSQGNGQFQQGFNNFGNAQGQGWGPQGYGQAPTPGYFPGYGAQPFFPNGPFGGNTGPFGPGTVNPQNLTQPTRP